MHIARYRYHHKKQKKKNFNKEITLETFFFLLPNADQIYIQIHFIR